MHDAAGQGAFDDAARAGIRRRLLHYMSEHRIGVIRLADRISKANRRHPEVPIKTLQRFLAGQFRTSDMYVGFFQHFSENLPEPDPIGELGKAMAVFLNATDSEAYGGKFMSEMSSDGGVDNVRSFSTLLITPERNFCRVVEQSRRSGLVICDGVLVGQGQTAVIALQDRTTKAPRQYLISGERDSYTAKGTEAVFRPGSDDVVRALSGWIAPPERIAMAANMSGPAVLEVERAHGSGLRVRRASVPFPTRRRRLLEKLAGAFRRTPVELPVETPGQSRLPDTDDNPLWVSLQFRDVPKAGQPMRRDQLQAAFLIAAERADEREVRRLVEDGADVNEPDPATGLTALHLSVGRDAIGSVRFLVEHGAAFVPDKLGRMPSMIAAESEVSEELCDYIAEAEARAEGV